MYSNKNTSSNSLGLPYNWEWVTGVGKKMTLKGLLTLSRKEGRLDNKMLETKGYTGICMNVWNPFPKSSDHGPPPSLFIIALTFLYMYLAPGWIFSHTVLVSEQKKKKALVISHSLVIVNLKNPAQLGYSKSGLARMEACWLISVALLERLI